MKPNQGKRAQVGPPYNEIYEAYEPLFLSLFAQRQAAQSAAAPACYVSMPDTERRLISFLKSRSTETCLLTGSIGIGKSSVLRHLTETAWNDPTSTETVFIDLNRRKATLKMLDLPENFQKLPHTEQKLIAERSITSYIASEIESHISSEFDFLRHVSALYEFFVVNNAELLMPRALFRTDDEEEQRSRLEQVQKENRVAFLYVCLKYYALERELDKLVIVVDNCDQKDPIFIEAFVDSVSHLDQCFESTKPGNYDRVPRLASIISCRPATQWMLQQRAQHNALGSHGSHVIEIQAPCALSTLIVKKAESLDFLETAGTVTITSRNGVVWETDRPKKFIHKLARAIEAKGTGNMLQAICNWNVADALGAMGEILSNRHFIDLDHVVGDVIDERAQSESGIARSAILRALAYGNAVERLIYPMPGTRIPNIISGVKSAFPKTFLKPRVAMLLLKEQTPGVAGPTREYVATTCARFFQRTEADILAVLNELYSQILVESDRGYPPSELPLDGALLATPRTRELWSQLAASDALLSCYRDDLECAVPQMRANALTSDLTLEQRAAEMLALCEHAVKGEIAEIQRIGEGSNLAEFFEIFGTTLVSESILGGFGAGIYDFYPKFIQGWKRSGYESRFLELRQRVESQRKVWLAGSRVDEM